MQSLKLTKLVEKCSSSNHILPKSSIKNLLFANLSSKPPRKPTDEFVPPPIKRNRVRKPSDGPPKPPTKCCQKGCDNCVWIRYAEELVLYYKDGGVEAVKAIDAIEDPALKAFLKMELKTKLNV